MTPKSRIFEIQPTSGVLDPGERANVQVKFLPKEEVSLKGKRGSVEIFPLGLSEV